MRQWSSIALAASLALTPVATAAGGPVFVWHIPPAGPIALPGPQAPFVVYTRFPRGRNLQYFILPMTAGETLRLSVLVPAGLPGPQLTVVTPAGSQLSFAARRHPEHLWLGMLPLRRTASYPYTAGVAGTYILALQPGAGAVREPYGIQGGGGSAGVLPHTLGRAAGTALLRAPLTWLQTLLWRLS